MARIGQGKSGGCRTCRRRKVKCDERRPGCERCETANRECEGYAREHRFVDENARTERHAKKKSQSPTTTPQSKPELQQDLIICSTRSSSSIQLSSLGLQAFEDNIFISFLISNLFQGIPVTTPWPHLQSEDHSSGSVQICFRALGTLFFGRAHHQQHITARGYALYGQALISLNRDLQDTEKGLSLSVVKSAMALEFYEFIAFSSTTGWLKHAGGLGRLIELRGPWRHQAPRERSLLEANRVAIALASLARRKRCFLERPEWKTVPWAVEPEFKTRAQFLHDILCDMPGLMEDAAMLQSSRLSGEEFTVHRVLLSENITSTLKTLYEWRVSWQHRCPNSCWEILSNEVCASTAEPTLLFPVVFDFASLTHANEITLYNAILLLLLRLSFQVISPNFDPSLPAFHLPQDLDYGPLFPPGLAPNAQAVAIEICKSVEYHLAKERRRAGAFFLLFPLRVAWQAFDPADKEALWLQGVMSMIADSTGFEVSRGLTSEQVVQSD
ncbi:uncharacterized protein PAC_15751 [Phialocephala subalpina]|uniref:Zn(2)-C6 fungal-type domain-containing protein n=1 Tax=Phialocephala subalpina TaxID=576137 RepID=A0A1L7XLB7_9HELO|nr:uncharacterized protein PAC_15751 [Phialocephala subalpina]